MRQPIAEFKPYNPITDEHDWIVVTEEKGTRYAVARASSRGVVASMPYGLTRDCQRLAQMVAATPKLLAALQGVVSGNVYGDPDDWNSRIDAARAVLAELNA